MIEERLMRVGINGMGRIGRLALRAALGAAERGDDDPRRGNRLEVEIGRASCRERVCLYV